MPFTCSSHRRVRTSSGLTTTGRQVPRAANAHAAGSWRVDGSATTGGWRTAHKNSGSGGQVCAAGLQREDRGTVTKQEEKTTRAEEGTADEWRTAHNDSGCGGQVCAAGFQREARSTVTKQEERTARAEEEEGDKSQAEEAKQRRTRRQGAGWALGVGHGGGS
jgi:hypothetical protein